MPSTIKNHAIDHNNDNYIDLKILKMRMHLQKLSNKHGLEKKSTHCFYKIEINKDNIKKIFKCISKN